jgi:hypothetical protein
MEDNVNRTFKVNDRVIWDSGFGYEVGYFKGDGNYDGWLLRLTTGIVTKECSYPESEVKPYSDELIEEMKKRYGYEKSFSKTF